MNKRILLLALLLFFYVLFFSFNVSAQSCGNGACETGENKCTCPTDCGSCSGRVGNEICQEFSCVNSKCQVVFVPFCCGNTSCEFNENYGVCPADCLPTAVKVDLISPSEGDFFVYGEQVLFKIELTSHGRKAISGEASVKSDFFSGAKQLFNDGKHDDGKAFDEFYAVSFPVPSDLASGDYLFNLDVNFLSVKDSLEVSFPLNPRIDVEADLDSIYFLGDFIEIHLEASRKGERIGIPLDVNIFDSTDSLIYSDTLSSDDGFYKIDFRTSLIDAPGTWRIEIGGVDEFNNAAEFVSSFDLVEPEEEFFLNLELLSVLERNYGRGEEIGFEFNLIDAQGRSVSGADLEFISSLNEIIPVMEDENSGVYRISYVVPFNFPEGGQVFSFKALKSEEKISYSGSLSVDLNISPIELRVELLEPSARFFKVGERIPVKLLVALPNNQRVSNVSFKSSEELNFIEIEPGLFQGFYLIKETDIGLKNFSVEVSDSFSNFFSSSFEVEVSGVSLIAVIETNLPIILLILAALLIPSFVLGRLFLKQNKVLLLVQRKEKLERLEKELQEKYFRKGILSQDDYVRSMQGYESEIKKIDKELEELR